MRRRKICPLIALLAICVSSGCGSRVAPEKISETSNEAVGSVVRIDPGIDSIVPPSARIERIASHHDFTTGPLYMSEGYLLFSDIPRNAIYKWTPDGTDAVFIKQSGYSGTGSLKGAMLGSSGLTVDKAGNLVACQLGNRRIVKYDKENNPAVLCDKFDGKRLNSPDQAVYKSDGALYFTDPPFGLAQQDRDPAKELSFNGVYRYAKGKLQLLTKELTRPKGIAFSPDEKFLYVSNSDPARKLWMRYEVKADGTIGIGNLFFDVSKQTEEGLPDGIKVDRDGNVYCAGPGGIWIFNSEGKHLGTIKPPETPSNLQWGKYADSTSGAAMSAEEYATTLYITAGTSVYRIALSAVGVRP
jgi:gluconolactonase